MTGARADRAHPPQGPETGRHGSVPALRIRRLWHGHPGHVLHQLPVAGDRASSTRCHVRGGKDKGYAWYEDGKREKKTNTFQDFIAAARHLQAQGSPRPSTIAQGGSAGGMLMGAIANMAPELFGGIIAEVPFVDVLTTMLDDSCRSRRRNGRMGQSDRIGQGLRHDRRLLALRQCRRKDLSAHPGGGGATDRASPIGSRRNGSRACARSRPAITRFCSRSTWTPATPRLGPLFAAGGGRVQLCFRAEGGEERGGDLIPRRVARRLTLPSMGRVRPKMGVGCLQHSGTWRFTPPFPARAPDPEYSSTR